MFRLLLSALITSYKLSINSDKLSNYFKTVFPSTIKMFFFGTLFSFIILAFFRLSFEIIDR